MSNAPLAKRRHTGRRCVLRKYAIRLEQEGAAPLYQFSLTPQELAEVADISRLSRDGEGTLQGYQRGAVKRHVQDIADYLDGDLVVFPNSLILALSSEVRFKRHAACPRDGGRHSTFGTLEIPLTVAEGSMPAWIVDGQQRALALARCRRQTMSVPINGFVAESVELQRDQFLRVNNTRALPRGLITELLPEVGTPLPSRLAARRIPATLCEMLNRDERSPFRGIIRRSSSAAPFRVAAVVADTSIVKMIEDSLSSTSGCLFPYRNVATGEADLESIIAVLLTYWTAVKAVFPGAWGRPPYASRLMHGVGIRAMGRLMDRVMASLDAREVSAPTRVQADLLTIKSQCRWTSGEWEGLGNMGWNELQNVPKHIQLLSGHLVRTYQAKQVRGAAT